MNQSLALFKTVKSQYTGASLNKAAVESTAGWSFAEFYCKSRKYYFFLFLYGWNSTKYRILWQKQIIGVILELHIWRSPVKKKPYITSVSYHYCLSVALSCGGSASENQTYLIQSSVTSLTSPCKYTVCPSSTDICRIRFDFTVRNLKRARLFLL